MNISFSLHEADKVAEVLLKTVTSKTLCFYGDMGAGKTTLIQALVKHLGAVDTVHSPTFGLVHEYHDPQGMVLAYHFDFYRLHHENEALDLGIEEYWDTNAWVLIEWPQNIASLLPQEAVSVHLHFIDETTRTVEFNPD